MQREITTYSIVLCSLMKKSFSEYGMTQGAFLQEAGIATGTWSRLLNGQSHFQIEDVRSACQVLSTSVGEMTTKADAAMQKLESKEDIEIVSKVDDGNGAGVALVAAAALLFLLSRD